MGTRTSTRTGTGKRPRAVPTPRPPKDVERAPDMPFAEGAHDEIDPQLRHRLISDAAYSLYAQRGYVDGFDIDDWLEAEARIDHTLLESAAGEQSSQSKR